MPHLRRLRGAGAAPRARAEDDYLPVLVLTADVTPRRGSGRSPAGRASDFLTKPFDVTEVLLRVRNLLETRVLHRQQQEARARAEALAAENARLFAEAQQATRARDRMLSVVAHDLRNPLALVAMNAEMLAELLPPRRRPLPAETVATSSSRRRRADAALVEDLLDVSRIEHGTFALERSATAPAELLAEAERMLRPLAEATGCAGVRRRGAPPRDRAPTARGSCRCSPTWSATR
jgi:signal transduction histidine kinase